MIFNLVADMFAIMIERATYDVQILGVVPHLVMVDYLSYNMLTMQFL
jgi:hypothetical protein